jgi:flap endonuclease-1
MTFSGKSNQKILEFDYNKAIAGLDITPDQFVDLCILCGCDYTDSIRGIGPKKALGYIKKYKTIEGVLKILDKSKYGIPVDWLPPRGASGAAAGGDESEPAGDEDNDIDADDEEVVEEEDADISGDEKDDALPADASLPEQANTEAKGDYGDDSEFIPAYVEARRLFKTPEAHPSSNFELVWRDPDEEGLKTFLVDKMQFNPERVSQGIKKLKDARKGGGQKRIDGFFKVLPSAEGAGTKRKPAPASTAGKGKGKGKARSAFKKGKK